MIYDRIIIGLLNDAISEKLQLDARLTLDITITCQSEEVHRRQQTVVRGKPTDLNSDLVDAGHASKGVDRKKFANKGGDHNIPVHSPQHNKGNRNVQGVVRLPATADSNALLEMLSAIVATTKVITSLCVEQSPDKYKPFTSEDQFLGVITDSNGGMLLYY